MMVWKSFLNASGLFKHLIKQPNADLAKSNLNNIPSDEIQKQLKAFIGNMFAKFVK